MRMLDAGWLLPGQRPEQVNISAPVRNFCRAIKSFDVPRVFKRTHPFCIIQYIKSHLSYSEQAGMCGRGRWHIDLNYIMARITSAWWTERFLAIRDGAAWEREYLVEHDKRCFYMPRVLEGTQVLVRFLGKQPGPTAVKDLPGRLKDMSESLSASSLQAGLRYLLVFASVREDDLEPVVDIWPGIKKRYNRPPAPSPSVTEPDETFRCSFLLEDMTRLLVACLSDTVRLQSGGGAIFVRKQKEIGRHMTPVPAWLHDISIYDRYSPEKRMQHALSFLRALGFVRNAGEDGKDLRLEATEQGEDWLHLSARNRLKELLDHLRYSFCWLAAAGTFQYGEIGFCPVHLEDRSRNSDRYFLTSLTRAFRSVPAGEFIRLDEFHTYHREKENPLLPAGGKSNRKPDIRYNHQRVFHYLPEQMETVWSNVLTEFLQMRLVPLEGAVLGYGPRRRFSFTLTETGRYLLSQTDDLARGEEEREEVIVQPNFEVVFLAPSPRTEALIGRFTERRGSKLGTMFKITRRSVLRAAEAGLTAEDMIKGISSVCTREIPENVRHEIETWFGQCRRITVRQTTLITCPDRETAGRVCSAGGNHVRPISETVLEMADPRAKSALLKKLKQQGIFLDGNE